MLDRYRMLLAVTVSTNAARIVAFTIALTLLLTAFAPANADAAKTKTFKSVDRRTGALVFAPRNVDPSTVRRAKVRLRRGGEVKVRRVSALKVRRAAARGAKVRVESSANRGRLRVKVEIDEPVPPPVEEPPVEEPPTEEPPAEEPPAEEPPVEEPPAEEPPAAGVIPGSGALVVQDLASDPDPSDLWVKSMTADPTQGADNSRIRQNEYAGVTAAPDPHATINGSTTDTFRRFSVNENDQSAYDLSAGNTSERAQLINNSESNTFYLARDGAHDIVYMSVRMQSPAPNWGTGQAGESQLLQFKPVGPGVPFLISMQETANGLLLRHNYQKNPQTLWTAPAVKGKWIRIALDIEWAQQGSITVWGDIDGGSQDLVQLSPTMNVRTIPEDLYPQNLSIGVYQDRTAPALWRDYANIQVARAR